MDVAKDGPAVVVEECAQRFRGCGAWRCAPIRSAHHQRPPLPQTRLLHTRRRHPVPGSIGRRFCAEFSRSPARPARNAPCPLLPTAYIQQGPLLLDLSSALSPMSIGNPASTAIIQFAWQQQGLGHRPAQLPTPFLYRRVVCVLLSCKR